MVRVDVRGKRSSGEPIEMVGDMPEELHLGDTFLIGAEHDRERVRITRKHIAFKPDGVEYIFLTVEPVEPPAID